jgi:hypothetical protein
MNDEGLVVGDADGTVMFDGAPAYGGQQGVQWRDGVPTTVASGYSPLALDAPGPCINDIDNAGDMVGGQFSSFVDPAYWNAQFQQTDLAVAWDYLAYDTANAIDGGGQIVGATQLGNSYRPSFATLWADDDGGEGIEAGMRYHCHERGLL